MINVSSPRHSFVQFTPDGQSDFNVFSCNPLLVNFHLPVLKEDDIAFQVMLEGTEAELNSLAYGFGILYNGNFYSLPNATPLRRNANLIILTHMAGFGAAFNSVPAGKCFRLQLSIGDQTWVSNVLERVIDECYTSSISYFSQQDSFGFSYCGAPKPLAQYENAKPPTGIRRKAIATSSYQWGVRGARVYQAGFPQNGFGTIVTTLTTPHFWVNGNFAEDVYTGTNGSNNAEGRMNKNAVWAEAMDGTEPFSPYDEFIGFTGKITLGEDKTLWVAFAADDSFKFRLNGNIILNTEGGGVPFHQWSVYPVSFRKGENNFEASVKNINLNGYNPAGFAMEIYDMTLQQLTAATKESDLKILYRTADQVGKYFDLGTTIAYSCENPEYTLVSENGEYRCKKITYPNPIDLYNKVRLPFYFTRPQYPTTEEIYIETSGTRKVITAEIAKEWQVLTDYMPDTIHEKLQIALRHESKYIECSKFESYFSINGTYEIEWPEILDYPLGTAKFKGFEESFFERSSPCGVCEVYTAPPPPPPCPDLLFVTKQDNGNSADSTGWNYQFTLGLPSNPPFIYTWKITFANTGEEVRAGIVNTFNDPAPVLITNDLPYNSDLIITFVGDCGNGNLSAGYPVTFGTSVPVEACQFDSQWVPEGPSRAQFNWRYTYTINYNGETPPALGWRIELRNQSLGGYEVFNYIQPDNNFTFDISGDFNNYYLLATALCAEDNEGTQLAYSFRTPATPSSNNSGKYAILINNTAETITVGHYDTQQVVVLPGHREQIVIDKASKVKLITASGTKIITLFNAEEDPQTFSAFINVGQQFNFESDANANPWGINNVNFVIISDPS